MPQLLLLAVVGAGVYFGLKRLTRTVRQARRKAAHSSKRQPLNDDPDIQQLEQDPETGVYRVHDAENASSTTRAGSASSTRRR